jgi:tetratricopeptide (TPR) repeat protein
MGGAGERIRIVRVLMVSPGDVGEERAVAQLVVDELNRGVAADGGCRLSLWRWEADARPGMHLKGPQGLIDELMDIQDADVVIGVFWRRFGTPTRDAAGGTEHELRRAWSAWQQHGRPDVMVYFCKRPYSPTAVEELVQWQRVLEFRDALPEQQLWWEYDSVGQFEGLLREHLTRFVLRCSGAARARVRFNLPAVAASFTGREAELDALDNALGAADRAVITQAITGLGGVGKSQLAARYVQTRTDGYDVVAWIRAEDGGIADLAALAARVSEFVDRRSPSERAQLALDWLSDSKQRWLLVLDNVESPKQLDGLLPRSGSGRVLVTSRDRALRQFGPVLTADVFDEDTATGYLTSRAGRPGDELAALELARALGCLPLALSHAAAYCQSGTSFTDYLKLLGDLPARELFDSHPEVSYAQTVASTWKTSIQAASNDAPLATDVLEMAAHLAPDAIPKSLFLVLVDPDTVVGQKHVADAFNALVRFSLASVNDDTISVHRLLQKTVRDDAAAHDDQTAASHALAALDDAFPDDVWLPTDWPMCEQLLPHALALADALRSREAMGSRLIGLLNRVCDYLNRAEPGKRGLATAQRTYTYANVVLSPDHPDLLTTRERLATAHLWSGRIKDAIAIFEPLLADRERILGAEHPDTLTTRHNVARAYQSVGRIKDAIAIFEPLLADRERILGAQHPFTLATRHNLARAYLEDGRTGAATAILERVLLERERILGPEHADALATRLNLARAYRSGGRVGEAIAILEQLFVDYERILGTEYPDTLIVHHDLAYSYMAAGRVGEAIALFEQLSTDYERILSADHPDTLDAHQGLARAYLKDRRVDEAIAILKPLVANREQILGTQHPRTLSAHHDLARAYRAAGRSADAERVKQRTPPERP